MVTSGHVIKMADNPVLHANLIAIWFIEPQLWPLEVLHCGNKNSRPFSFMTLTLTR